MFDYAEAFTVIDVNTGRFVGSRSKSSTQRLEDTVVKNNLEAVKEVVRQLRLRDIGGIIVIDFIDMANPKNRQAVEDALRQELERDRTKTYVVEISPLGLVEMTRQNVTDGPREVMTRKCPTCGGDGIVVSDATVALDVERKLRTLAAAGAGSRVQAYRVALHPRTLALVAGPGGERLATLEDVTRRRFFLVPAEGHAHADHFEVLAEGQRADLAPSAPFEEGAELDVKLVEVDLYDAGAAVGRVEGFQVVVAGAANRVGKKATVAVGRVLEGQAFATPVGGEVAAAPITFESEAEKPTRAPAKRRSGDAKARSGRGRDGRRGAGGERARRRGDRRHARDCERGEGPTVARPRLPLPRRRGRGVGRGAASAGRSRSRRPTAPPRRPSRQATAGEPRERFRGRCRDRDRTSRAAAEEADAADPRARRRRPPRPGDGGAKAGRGRRACRTERRLRGAGGRAVSSRAGETDERRGRHDAAEAHASRLARRPEPQAEGSGRGGRRRDGAPWRPPSRTPPTGPAPPGRPMPTSRCPSGSTSSTNREAHGVRYNPAARGRCPRFPRPKA